jgi:hypothetical protein
LVVGEELTKDAALRAIQDSVLRFYQGEAHQRTMLAEIVMTLEEAGYMPDAPRNGDREVHARG